MHDLIVHPAVHFPVPRLRRMRRKQVARRIRVRTVNRRVKDTRALEPARLGREHIVYKHAVRRYANGDALSKETHEDDELSVPVSVRDEPRVHAPRHAEVLPVLLGLLCKARTTTTSVCLEWLLPTKGFTYSG